LSSAAAVAALALATGGVLAGGAQARAAAKPAGPTLTIESKVCNIGPTDDDRFATITASALLGTAGDRVSMRFTVQQRPIGASSKWVTIPADPASGLGTWQTGDAGHSGLRYTKTFNGLDEGQQYRVYVDARGVDDDGTVATKQSRKTAPCNQPLFTPTLSLLRAVDGLDGGVHTVTATIRNLGREQAAPAVVTVQDATTRAVLGTVTTDAGLKGGTQAKVDVPISACNDSVFVTVQQQGAALADLTPAQSATISCATAPSSKIKAR